MVNAHYGHEFNLGGWMADRHSTVWKFSQTVSYRWSCRGRHEPGWSDAS